MQSEAHGDAIRAEREQQEREASEIAIAAEAEAAINWRVMSRVELLRDGEIADIFLDMSEADGEEDKRHRRELLKLVTSSSEIDEAGCKRAFWLAQRLIYAVAWNRAAEDVADQRKRAAEDAADDFGGDDEQP